MVFLNSVLTSLSKIWTSTWCHFSVKRCIMELYARILCLSFILTNGAWRIVFESQWYAIIMYSLTLLYLIGNLPQSSVYSLLMGWSQIRSSFVWIVGSSSSSSYYFFIVVFHWPFYFLILVLFLFGGSHSLWVLHHMSFDGFHLLWTITCRVFLCQSWPCFKVSFLYCLKPCGFHWKSGYCTHVSH